MLDLTSIIYQRKVYLLINKVKLETDLYWEGDRELQVM